MPIEIKKGERETDFIPRCISEEVSSGKENDQAVAICYSYWREKHKMSVQEMFISQMNEYRTKMTFWLAEDGICPPETLDIELNLKNRQHAIDVAHYGPQNPNEPNDAYWKAKAEQFHSGDVEAAKKSLCGNCAFFDKTQKVLDCIAEGIGGEDAWSSIDAGAIALCTAFDFKCAASRTCDAWVIGGPITD